MKAMVLTLPHVQRSEHAYALKTNAILFYYLNKAFCRMHEYEVMYPLWLCKINNCNMTVNSVSVVYCWTTEQLLSLGYEIPQFDFST